MSEGGTTLNATLQGIPLQQALTGWTQDKYGLSWQLMLSDPEGEDGLFITPSLMFVGDNCGKAEEAVKFYLSVFRDTGQGALARYPQGHSTTRGNGDVLGFSCSRINGLPRWIAHTSMALPSMRRFLLWCIAKTGPEIDYFWDRLSETVPEAEQCGWLKDKFGLSWQIVPTEMDEMMKDKDEKRVTRVTKAFLQMKKFDIAKLKEAFEGAGNLRRRTRRSPPRAPPRSTRSPRDSRTRNEPR